MIFVEIKEFPDNVIITTASQIPPEKIELFLDEVVDVEKRTWPDELQASREKFASRIKVFDEGFIVARANGRALGVSTAQINFYDPSKSPTWDELTDSGFLIKSHNKDGDALYVASVGVAADSQGIGIGGKLVESQKELAKKLGLKYLFLGARIPDFDAYCKENEEVSAEEYLALKNEKGEPVDPEIRFYSRQGLNPTKLIPNSEPDDQKRGYGVNMDWEDNKLRSSILRFVN